MVSMATLPTAPPTCVSLVVLPNVEVPGRSTGVQQVPQLLLVHLDVGHTHTGLNAIQYLGQGARGAAQPLK